MILFPSDIQSFQEKMLLWYSEHGRQFPWRETSDPFKILVAEFLLQKTSVRKVPEIYSIIIKKFPDIHRLASADLLDLRQVISPIGLTYRADRLIRVSQDIINYHNCIIPSSYDVLIQLYGVGDYIANAVLIFAYEKSRVLIDPNVLRVLKIELNLFSDKTRARSDKKFIEFVQTLAPSHHIKEFNWALLDYGAVLSK